METVPGRGTLARGKRPPEGEPVVDRALSLLSAFDAGRRRLSLAELSRRSGMPASTTLRLATRLVSWGALERDEQRRYCIGLRLLEVASLAPRGHGLRQVALPFMALGAIVNEATVERPVPRRHGEGGRVHAGAMPSAPRGAVLLPLNPDLADMPQYTADHPISTALSPDGATASRRSSVGASVRPMTGMRGVRYSGIWAAPDTS